MRASDVYRERWLSNVDLFREWLHHTAVLDMVLLQIKIYSASVVQLFIWRVIFSFSLLFTEAIRSICFQFAVPAIYLHIPAAGPYQLSSPVSRSSLEEAQLSPFPRISH